MKDKLQINANERRLINRSNHESAHSCLGLLNNKPQMNADERRFANLNIQRSSEVYPEQSSAIPVTTYEKVEASRFRTRMTRIARIFAIYTYPCASASSAQSVFYYTTSLFCVHPLPIMSMKEKTKAFYYALINKTNTIFYQKSDSNDRHFLLQRT